MLTSAPAVDHIRRVRFSGTVRFGKFEREFEFPGGLRKHAGIHDATLHNVTVGDDCLIENISNYIANYDPSTRHQFGEPEVVMPDQILFDTENYVAESPAIILMNAISFADVRNRSFVV